MKKREVSKKLFVIPLILLALMAAIYFIFFYSPVTSTGGNGSVPTISHSPLKGLSHEEAVKQFNETFVSYLLYSIDADSLHNAPFSSEPPTIIIGVGDEKFNAVVKKGVVYVSSGDSEGADVKITTDAGEAVKMIEDKNYIAESFKSGKSSFELKASKATLFSKGYLNIYEKFTGESLTGSAIGSLR